MNSVLIIKFLGGLTVTAGIGTGSYFLKEHIFKSPEEPEESPKPQEGIENPPGDSTSQNQNVGNRANEADPNQQPSPDINLQTENPPTPQTPQQSPDTGQKANEELGES